MLKIDKLSFSINKEKILENISFSAKSGSITVITGSNGSGKTTLLKSIIGINSAKGKIWLDEKEISKLDVSMRAKTGLAYAFQHPAFFKGITVKQLLEIANPEAKNLDNACLYLSQVGLCARDYLDREFNKTLSGGERKRIELALCLARNAKVYLFDEPESGIDMWSFDSLTEIFNTLKKQGKIVIIVSHNKKIMKNADNIVLINKGKIIDNGPPETIFDKLENNTCIKLQGGN
jgi:Fe-S cluster assembly ATP-binding protein